MRTGEITVIVLVLLFSLAAFFISCLQFMEKGFVWNNSYLYASKKERETMNKKPLYRQSAIVFLLIGMLFLVLAAAIFFSAKWLYILEGVIAILIIVYAVVSSISIERKK